MMSLLFVHTARRTYRWNDSVKHWDCEKDRFSVDSQSILSRFAIQTTFHWKLSRYEQRFLNLVNDFGFFSALNAAMVNNNTTNNQLDKTKKVGGRKKSFVWNYFHDTPALKASRKCRCNLCHLILQASPVRMEHHIYSSCLCATIEIKNELKAKILSDGDPHKYGNHPQQFIDEECMNHNYSILDDTANITDFHSEGSSSSSCHETTRSPVTSPAVERKNPRTYPRAPIWRYFTDDQQDAVLRLTRQCRCAFCHQVLQAQPKRMERHLLRRCTRVPRHIVEEVRQEKHRPPSDPETSTTNNNWSVPDPELMSSSAPELIQYYPFHLYTIWLDPTQPNVRFLQILILLPAGQRSQDCELRIQANLLILHLGTTDAVAYSKLSDLSDWNSLITTSSMNVSPASFVPPRVHLPSPTAMDEWNDDPLLNVQQPMTWNHPPLPLERWTMPEPNQTSTVQIPLPLYGTEQIMDISEYCSSSSDIATTLSSENTLASHILKIQLRGPIVNVTPSSVIDPLEHVRIIHPY